MNHKKKEPGHSPGSFFLVDAAALDQGRFSFLDVYLKAVPGVVNNHDSALRVYSDATRMS